MIDITNLDQVNRACQALLDEVDYLLLTKRQPGLTINTKTVTGGRLSLVTEADLAADKLITDWIKEFFPQTQILSEESEPHGQADWTWVIDPIDGTTNYSRNLPLYGVMMSLWHRTKPVYGVISLPSFRQRVWNNQREELVLDETVIDVQTNLFNEHKPMVTIAPVADAKTAGQLHALTQQAVGRARDFGSAAYQTLLLLAGQTDVLVCYKLGLWDIGPLLALAPLRNYQISWLSPKPTNQSLSGRDYEHSLIVGQPDLVKKIKQQLTKLKE